MTTSGEQEQKALLFNLVYCSRASSQLDSIDLDRIVSSAQKSNAREHITGWLVYSTGIFFQWLEGYREDVKRLMAIIAADPRHTNVVILSEAEEVRERSFSGWHMELVSAEDIRAVIFDAISATTSSTAIGSMRLFLKTLDARTNAIE